MIDWNSQRARYKRIAYLIGTYPLLTTTFVDREILEAKRAGVNVAMVAIRRGELSHIGIEVKQLAEEAKYLLPVPWLKFMGANLYFGLARFGTYFSTLFYLLTRPHNTITARAKTLLHFGEGVWAAALLRSEQVDHIHAHFADRAAIVSLVASRLLNVPYSLTAHANDIYVSPVLLSEKIANAKFTTTCTGYNKAYLERETGCQVELIYHGLDLSAIEPAAHPPCNDHPPLILSVGQLKEKKGFPYLIGACRLLKEQGYDFRCEIVGEGPDRGDLEALVAELKLQDMVKLCGALPNAEVMVRYPRAALFALPCVVARDGDRDGIPNVLLEAMAHEVPVVSTRVSAIPEVVQDGITGLLVESRSEETLAKAIAKLLGDAELREKLGQQGRRWVKKNFDIRVNVGRLIELFRCQIATTDFVDYGC